MPTGHGSRELWTRREETIVERFYARGVDEVAALLPNRTPAAIQIRAVKLGVAGDTPAGLRQACAGEDREAIIALHDQGMGYEAIARLLEVDAQSVTTAVLTIECKRAGFTPAERDAAGGLLPHEAERMYGYLRDGLPGVEIQRRMAVSASCVSHYRRRLKRAGENPPPPGNGLRYSGSRIPDDVRSQVELHFMAGFGAAKVAELAGVQIGFAKKFRRKLVERLAARGECLPGCDASGRRVAVRESASFITDQQKIDLQWLWLHGWPVAPAAKHLRIGGSSAHKIIQTVKEQLVEQGKSFPKALPPARRPALGHQPTPKARPIARPKRAAPIAAFPALKAATIIDPAALPEIARPAPPPPRRRLSFEEQLARIAAGQAGIVPVFKPTRPITDATLGGVGSSLL